MYQLLHLLHQPEFLFEIENYANYFLLCKITVSKLNNLLIIILTRTFRISVHPTFQEQIIFCVFLVFQSFNSIFKLSIVLFLVAITNFVLIFLRAINK